MNQSNVPAFRNHRRSAAVISGALLLWAALPVRAWEVGFVSTWIHNDASGGGGLAHGVSALVQEEVCHYSDVGARVGYMRSDCFKTYYVPIELTLDFKYPLAEERFVPFVGIIGGYHIFTQSHLDLQNAFSISPMIGCDFRFGSRKQWAFHVEGLWQFSHADLQGGGTSKFDGPGGAGGLTYRF